MPATEDVSVIPSAGSVRDVAEAYLVRGDHQRAAEVLQSGLAEDPDNAGLLTHYAWVRMEMKDFQGAAWAAHAALTAAPDNEHVMGLYALALNGQSRFPEALWMAWKTAAEHPDSYRAHYTYASLLREYGQVPEALIAVNEALRLNPVSVDALVLRGDLHRALWGSAAAEADYQEALRLKPDHAWAMHNLAVSRLRWGKTTKALRGFLEAGRLDPELGELVRTNVGVALFRVLRWATSSVVLLAVALIVVMATHQESQSTVVPRVFVAVLTLGLAAAVIWVVRNVPGPMLRAVLRERLLLAVRFFFLMIAVIAGLATTVLGSTLLTNVSGTLLLIGVFCINVLAWLFRQ